MSSNPVTSLLNVALLKCMYVSINHQCLTKTEKKQTSWPHIQQIADKYDLYVKWGCTAVINLNPATRPELLMGLKV